MSQYILLHTNSVLNLILLLLSGMAYVYLKGVKEYYIGKKFYELFYLNLIVWYLGSAILVSIHPTYKDTFVHHFIYVFINLTPALFTFIFLCAFMYEFIYRAFQRERNIVLTLISIGAVITIALNVWNQFYNHGRDIFIAFTITYAYIFLIVATNVVIALRKYFLLKSTDSRAAQGHLYMAINVFLMILPSITPIIFPYDFYINHYSYYIISCLGNLAFIVIFINFGAIPTTFQFKMIGFVYVCIMFVFCIVTFILFKATPNDEIPISLTQQEGLAKMIAIILISTIVLLLVFPKILQTTLVKPLQNLLTGVQKINEGDLSTQVMVSQNDEIGDLIKHFNRMTARLHQAQQDLKQSYEEKQQILATQNALLEQQVEARTAELSQRVAENAQLFAEAQEARAQAEEANEAKSSFLSTISHELRTPLTSVIGFAKIIRKRLEEKIFPLVQTSDPKIQRNIEQVSENLVVVISEGERLTNLINDVLDLAKIEAGRVDWKMEEVSLEALIEHAKAVTTSLFDAKKLGLYLEVQTGLPTVVADHDRILQVLINLLSNAVKFTDKGKVIIHAKQELNQLVVSIQDSGLGIAPADQAKVFEKFKQVGDTLTDKPKGTGLGLPICKEIVEYHGGQLWLESTLGKGSTFSFSLPLKTKLIDTEK